MYNRVRKTFVVGNKPSLFSTAITKPLLWSTRFSSIQQRLLRNPLYNKNISYGHSQEKATFSITPLESVGNASGYVRTFGMLTVNAEDNYVLEDPMAIVKLDLSNAKIEDGFYTENSFMIADGNVVDSILCVDSLVYYLILFNIILEFSSSRITFNYCF